MKKLFLIALLAMAGPVSAQFVMRQAGEQAPVFSATDATGQSVKLRSYRGKPVVLEWTDLACETVRKQYDAGSIQTLQQEMAMKGGIWLTILSTPKGAEHYLDTEAARTRIMEKGAHPSSVILDSEGALAQLYGVHMLPHFFVVDPEGLIVYAGALEDKTSNPGPRRNYIREAWEAASTGGATEKSSVAPYGCPLRLRRERK